MAAERRPLSPGQLALSLLCLGLLSTASLEAPTLAGGAARGPYPTFDPPILEARLGRGRLVLNGTTGTRAHEDAIGDVLAERLVDIDTDLQFNPGTLVPDHWQTLSLEFLRAVTTLESAEASIGPSEILIRGVTAKPADYSVQVARLRSVLPAAYTIAEQVTTVAPGLPLRGLCEKTFAAFGSRSVKFERGSATLRTSSNALLDGLIEFAYDCRDVAIRITGHSDASGDERQNLELSLHRAQAVADYLARNGIDSDRLYVEGKGSAEPIGDNATAHGRRLNRRIEFSLR